MNKPSKPPVDRAFHAALAQMTGGVSPAALGVAYLDWATHLAASPGKQAELAKLAGTEAAKAMFGHVDPADQQDSRFADQLWNYPPFCYYRSGFLAAQHWWDAATADLPGVDKKHARLVNFSARQLLDMMAPTNSPLTNPSVIAKALQTQGHSVLTGLENWLEDLNASLGKGRPQNPDFVVGETLAITDGDVVYRNDLVELIRYKPTQAKVRPEPIFIVPAWIMKYYVLDLSPYNSLVRYLVNEGFDVFIISWKNPGKADADLGMQDYIDQGVRACRDQIKKITGAKHMHGVGYCLGGTLLAIAAAADARDNHDGFRTLSFLASQVDFSEPGEIGLFINESQVTFLEDMMAERGYLRADQMAGAFAMLRSNDLIWSRVIRHYLLGERTPMNDLMAWNADATRMPARMHSEYLRHFFLENALAKGVYTVDGHHISLTDIRAPTYCLATEKDHVSPWRSVFRWIALTDTDVRFVLTNGGHNGGVLSEPGHKGRHFRILDKTEGAPSVGKQVWFDKTEPQEGSWWNDWLPWLNGHSGVSVTPRKTARALGSAPGQYVFG
ncbi:MAG: alpha/beta fold hydrolase [Pseudomonadota bacterium]